MKENRKLLELIRGKVLTSVNRAVDYLDFQFEDLILSALALPTLVNGAEKHTLDLESFGERTKPLINQRVSLTDEKLSRLEIEFEGGTRLVIPLDVAFPPGPEMAILSGKGDFIAEWSKPQEV